MPGSESPPPPDSTVAHHQNLSWGTRVALFVLHITILVAAMSLTPDGYFFRLGEDTGVLLVSSSIILWWLLLSAKTRSGITTFCVLALGQAGFMAGVGLHFKAEDRALRPILEEIAGKQNRWKSRWESQMGQFRMAPLFEMISGKRQLSIGDLREVQTQARAGRAKLSEAQSDMVLLVADGERRIASVSSVAASDFRRGYESTRPASEEGVKAIEDYFTDVDQLAEFLINRQGQCSQTPNGLVFKRDVDTEAFNKQRDAIAHLQDQVNSLRHSLGQ